MTAATASAGWADICAVSDIPLRGARVVATPDGDVAVFRTGDGSVFALDDRCPHHGGRLSQGIVHGHAVTCPLHNWVISLSTGVAEPPDEGCAAAVGVRVTAGRILLAIGPR